MKTAIAGAALSFFFLLSPLQALAATNSLLNPIVPAECHCENQTAPDGSLITSAAGYGCVLQTVQNGVNVLISLSVLVFVLWLAYAGALFMASSASPGLREQGKTRIMNAVIGIIVILAAWLIVDFIMKTLYDNSSDFGPWNSILASKGNDTCIAATEPVSITSGSWSIVTGAPGTMINSVAGGGTGGDRCVVIPDSQLVAIDSSGHKLIAEAAQRFAKMKAAAAKDGVTLVVSSAYRTPDQQTAAWNNNGCHVVNGKAVCTTLTAAIPCSLNGSGSNHSTGVAVDIGGAGKTWVKAHGSAYGFINALSNDPVHFSLNGK
ncbi:MAG: D-alanyl-D-alanine carboxypeptidase family protein [Candidatus Paceibacterota bacterium]